MSIILRQSTTGQEVPLGPFLDPTDGDSEETGLTINAADILIWKTGATTLAAKNSGGATHISDGIYYAVLDATDTNTVGSLKIYVHVAGALFVTQTCLVYPAAVYDSLVAGTDYLPTDSVQVGGDTQSATDLKDFADTGYNPTAHTLGTLAHEAIADAVHDEVVEGTTTLRHSVKLLNSVTAGKVTGGGTTSIVYRDIGDTKNRITLAVDANGNRSAVTTVVT